MAVKEEKIRDFSGLIIGLVQTKDNGDKAALDFPSRLILGEYIKSQDHTIEFPSRQIVARGDTVVSFIYNKKK